MILLFIIFTLAINIIGVKCWKFLRLCGGHSDSNDIGVIDVAFTSNFEYIWFVGWRGWMVTRTNGDRICHKMTSEDDPMAESVTVSISSNGQYVFIVSGKSDNTAYCLYKSNNFGDSFSQKLTGLTRDRTIVQTSDSGQYVAVSSGSSNIYISTNFGDSFQSNVYINSNVYSYYRSLGDFKVSGSGQYLFSPEKFSTDFGQNWNSWSVFTSNVRVIGSTKDGKFVLGIYEDSGQVKGLLSSDYGNSFSSPVGIYFFLT